VRAENPNPWKKRGEDLRRMSKGLAIPSLMLGGPLGGALIGYFVGVWLEAPQKGLAYGALAGIAFAIYEVVRVIRQMSAEQDPERRNRE
jgi:F0F1-type ATP synthase assembly protein I